MAGGRQPRLILPLAAAEALAAAAAAAAVVSAPFGLPRRWNPSRNGEGGMMKFGADGHSGRDRQWKVLEMSQPVCILPFTSTTLTEEQSYQLYHGSAAQSKRIFGGPLSQTWKGRMQHARPRVIPDPLSNLGFSHDFKPAFLSAVIRKSSSLFP